MCGIWEKTIYIPKNFNSSSPPAGWMYTALHVNDKTDQRNIFVVALQFKVRTGELTIDDTSHQVGESGRDSVYV